MMKKMIAILLIALTMTLLSAEKYAVLIAGDYNATGIPTDYQWNNGVGNTNTEFWNDTYLMWELLTQEKGYKPENVKVLFAKGQDLWRDPIFKDIDTRYKSERYGILDITNFAATEANVQAVCADLESKMEYGEDFLFVWAMSHSSNSSIYLLNDTVTGNVAVSYETFANYFKSLNALNKVYWLNMNSAENLSKKLEQENAVIISSSSSVAGYNKSYQADDELPGTTEREPGDYVEENELIDSDTYYHGEVNFHLYSSTIGKKPNGETFYYSEQGIIYDEFNDADTNYDNQIGINEAYQWMYDRVSTEDLPRIYETTLTEWGRSYYLSLKYPTLLSNGPDGVCWGTPFPAKGIIGISDNIWYFSENDIEPFSEATFFDSDTENPIVEGDFVFDNCDVNGEYDKFPVNLAGSFTLKGARLKNLQLNVSAGTIIPFNGTISGSEIILSGPENIAFLDNSRLTLRDCSIIGDMNIPENATVIINNEVRLKSGSTFSALENSVLELGMNGRLIIEDGAVCRLTDMTVISSASGKIVPESGGEYIVLGCQFLPNYDSPEPDKAYALWSGIEAGPGSIVSIVNSEFTGVETAISGTPASITVAGCTFTECENGVDLINCNNYTIENNDFTGVGIGSGIALTQSEGVLSGNSVSGFSHGIDITLCSPMLSKNTIFGNTNYGVCILGYNANPQFINPGVSQNYLNNEISDNGTAQMYLKYSASAYMTNGKNNIYSGVSGVIPEVPCIMGVSNTAPTTKVALPSRVDIDAEYNYWGYSDIETNKDSFFDLWTMSTYNGYRIAYQPYSTVPYRSDNQLPNTSLSAQSGPDTGSILLSNAIKQELNGKYTSSINLYEKVIDKYDSTAEAFVAMARLPYVYAKEELDSDPLIKLYDEALQSEDELNRKFYKEMKVSTLLKAKKYNDAKNISIEMREEAESEGEVLLAEIDIAIAEMMMNAQNRGKSNSNVNTMNISDLISKLTGNEDKAEPSYAQNNVLPESSTLYQNYPNPFNPVTQIKFSLAKTADVKLSVYNISGQMIAELANGSRQAGVHAVEFDGSKLNSGVYYYTLEVDGKTHAKRMVLTK